ncbi:hypothetical protein CROQUDRAFT_704703 [Cronartium quercuum f. sp. fusiforme G11]|uniref:Uncharacterized protein n=1 Tax=Cronartium quercuum f. sp. fusiforme G11 TaxID=708437 RepID=A0A9P6NKG7_9BASI|nr:hypothetical protein CROQUDRAFT_704703 [Cronartium quercuum f. sp. fusiforme G11]
MYRNLLPKPQPAFGDEPVHVDDRALKVARLLYNHIAPCFLGILQLWYQHRNPPNHLSNPDFLIEDGWKFFKDFFGKWENLDPQTEHKFDPKYHSTVKCYEHPNYLASHLLMLAETRGKVSIRLLYSLWMTWHEVSEFSNKGDGKDFEDFTDKV